MKKKDKNTIATPRKFSGIAINHSFQKCSTILMSSYFITRHCTTGLVKCWVFHRDIEITGWCPARLVLPSDGITNKKPYVVDIL